MAPHLWDSVCLGVRLTPHTGIQTLYHSSGLKTLAWSKLLTFTSKKLTFGFFSLHIWILAPPTTSTCVHSHDRWDQAFPVFRPLPLPCIILNTNRKTKTREAWERGYFRLMLHCLGNLTIIFLLACWLACLRPLANLKWAQFIHCTSHVHLSSTKNKSKGLLRDRSVCIQEIQCIDNSSWSMCGNLMQLQCVTDKAGCS